MKFEELKTSEIKEMLDEQTTFDGRLMPDTADSYTVKQLVDVLIERSFELERN